MIQRPSTRIVQRVPVAEIDPDGREAAGKHHPVHAGVVNVEAIGDGLFDGGRTASRAAPALALDPVSATLASDAGVVFLWAGRYEGVERHCAAAIELAPEARAARRCLVRVAYLTGRSEVGVEPAARLLETDGPGSVDGSASEVLRRYWDWVLDRTGEDGCGPVARARALIVLGRPDEAVESLEILAEDASACMLEVVADPMFDDIRSDSSVTGRIDRLGLPSAAA